eukprot:14646866-Alexandrium_andersonii.AAC.1
MRDGEGRDEEQIWRLLITEVRDANIGPWWREWMADQWAERLGFSELSETNDKDGLQVMVDMRKPGAEDLVKCIQTKDTKSKDAISQSTGEMAEQLNKL